MDNKFGINSEEVIRILSLHEDATKNQYLNVISEQQVQQTGGLNKTNGQYKTVPLLPNQTGCKTPSPQRQMFGTCQTRIGHRH